MSFTLKEKPKPPKRAKKKETLDLQAGWTDAEKILAFIKQARDKYNVDPEQIEVENEWSYDEGKDVFLCYTREETDIELEERSQAYKRELKKYQGWYEKNKTKVVAELKRRQEKTHQDKIKALQLDVKRAKLEVEKAERNLKALKKET
jgi:hypothetical protein